MYCNAAAAGGRELRASSDINKQRRHADNTDRSISDDHLQQRPHQRGAVPVLPRQTADVGTESPG